MPDVDLHDNSLDHAVQQEFRRREQARAKAQKKKDGTASATAAAQDDQLYSIIHTVGQLDFGESGEQDFQGLSSGAVFMEGLKAELGDVLGKDYRVPFMPKPRVPGNYGLDSIRSSGSMMRGPDLPLVELPPLSIVLRYCDTAFSYATCLLRIVHRPDFRDRLERLYKMPRDKYGPEETRFVALVYAVMALGTRYIVPENSDRSEMMMEQG